MEKTWDIATIDQELVGQIAEACDLPLCLATVLVSRGIQSVDEGKYFLSPLFDNINDPFSFSMMNVAVQRILTAIDKKESIGVYGDYDVDGITGVAMLAHFLPTCGVSVETMLANRMAEGYGIHCSSIDRFSELGVSLVITVDCGSNAVEVARYARQKGIDLIITDHHLCDTVLPDACAILNPQVPNETYPFKGLAGVGVAYKLVHALIDATQDRRSAGSPVDLESYLDLVSLGTVADVVPLVDENRMFVLHGLKVLSRTQRPGLIALKEACGITDKVSTAMISYRMAPRINAVGRLGQADKVISFLTTDNVSFAREFVQFLERSNVARKEEEEKVIRDVDRQFSKDAQLKDRQVIVLANGGWHEGVLGIVASRVVERYGRPTVLISLQGDVGKGSARSLKGVDINKILGSCSDLLERYGGHSQAAGLLIKRQHVEQLQSRLLDPQHEEDALGRPTVDVDASMDFSELSFDFFNRMDLLEPFGYGNKPPVFVTRGVKIQGIPKIVGGKHVKMYVIQNRRAFGVIGFGMAGRIKQLNPKMRYDIVFSPQINEFRGNRTIQLVLEDFAPVGKK